MIVFNSRTCKRLYNGYYVETSPFILPSANDRAQALTLTFEYDLFSTKCEVAYKVESKSFPPLKVATVDLVGIHLERYESIKDVPVALAHLLLEVERAVETLHIYRFIKQFDKWIDKHK